MSQAVKGFTAFLARVILRVGLLGGLLGVLVAALVWSAPALTQLAISAGLRRAGLPPLAFRVDRVSVGELQLSGIRLDSGELAARRLVARWRLSDLRRGRVDSIEVEGLALRGRWGDTGVSFGALDPWLRPSASAAEAPPAPMVPPANHLLVRDAAIGLEHPGGSQRLVASAELRLHPTREGHAALQWSVSGRPTGHAELRIDDAGRMRLELELRAGRDAVAPWLPALAQAWPPEAVWDAALSAEGVVDAEAARLDRFSLSLPATPLLGREGRIRATGSGRGSMDELAADFELDAELAGSAASAATRARGPLRVHWQPDRLRVELPACLDLALSPGPLSAALRIERDARLCVRTREDAGIDVELAGARATRYSAGLALSSPALALRTTHDEPFRLGGRELELRLDLSGSAGDAPHGTLALRGSRIELPTRELRLDRPTLEGRFSLGDVGSFQGDFDVGTLHDTRSPTRFPPLAGSGRVDVAPERVRFDARARDDSGSLRARIEGEHALPSGVGHARLTSEPLLFGEGHATGKALARWLGPSIQLETGRGGADLQLAWSPRSWTSRADVHLADADLSAYGVRIRGLEGAVRLRELTPTATDGTQELRFRSADLGLAFGAGRIVYALAPEGVLHIEPSQIELAGGRLELSGVIDLNGGPQQRLDFHAVGVDLPRLLRLVPIAGLQASGSLSGEMQLAVADGRPVLRGGVFRVMEGGHIQYRPEGPGAPAPATGAASAGDPTAVVREIMRDFHYDVLNIAVSGWLDERASAQAQLRGYNPSFQNGHPVNLTLNLTTGFAQAVDALPELRALFQRFAAPSAATTSQSQGPRP